MAGGVQRVYDEGEGGVMKTTTPDIAPERALDFQIAQLIYPTVKEVYYGPLDDIRKHPLIIFSGKPWRTHHAESRLLPRFSTDWTAVKPVWNWLNAQVPEVKRQVNQEENKEHEVWIRLDRYAGRCRCAVVGLARDLLIIAEGEGATEPEAIAWCVVALRERMEEIGGVS
jgi:hypothetical protein